MAVTINVVGNYDDRELARAQASLGKLASTTSTSGKTYSSAMGKMKASTIALGTAMGTAAVAGAVAMGRAIKDQIGASITAASDLAEVTSKVGVLFGKQADEIDAWASKAANAMGQSKTQAMDAAATFATFGKSAGLAGSDLTAFAQENVKLASDLASFSNTSPEEAITALGAALRGESEPIRRYGVLLDDATLRAQAMKMGLIKTTTQALTPQQKVLAAQAQIMKQTTAAQGDFKRTSGGLANQQRILAANLENVRAKVGGALLPVITAMVTFINQKLLPALKRWWKANGPTILNALKQAADFVRTKVIPALQAFGGWVQRNQGWLTKLAVVITTGVVAFKLYMATVRTAAAVSAAYAAKKQALIMLSYNERVIMLQNTAAKVRDIAVTVAKKTAELAAAAATKAVAAAQWLLNAAMSANPIGLVIAAIVALVAVIVVLWKKNETFRKVVLAVWDAVKRAFKVAIDAIVGYLKLWWRGVQAVWAVVKGAFKVGVAVVSAYIRTWVAVVRAVWSAISGAFKAGVGFVSRTFASIVGFFRDTWSKVSSFFTELPGKLLGYAHDLIDGFTQGIRDKAGEIVDTIKEFVTDKIPGFIKDAFGISSPAKVMVPLGKNVVLGLAKGIRDEGQELEKAMAEVLKRMGDAAAAGLAKVQQTAKAALELARSTAQSITEGGAVTGVTMPDSGMLTAHQLVGDMAARVKAAKAFGGNLRKLQKAGLNAQSLREVLAAGPTAGNAIAEALLQGGGGAIRQVNQLERQLKLTGQRIGSFAADQQYGMTTRDAQGVMATKVEVKAGAVVVHVGAGADRDSARAIKGAVEDAVEQAMRKVMREARAGRRGKG